jgi:DNA-binding transcriptional ArsR family regulator
METAKEGPEIYYLEELHSIKEELVSLRNDFSRFLQRANQQHIEGMIDEMRKSFMKPMKLYHDRLEELKKEAKSSDCSRCFSEAINLFEKQIKLMRSLQIYEDREEDNKKIDISEIEPEKLVTEVCEPVANQQRLLMLKALSGESKTFSELSRLTGLRGGNLLFHLQKLLGTGMILQRNERGDYIITRKGYSTLQGLSRIYSEIEQD